jgi:hypothetical protein
MGAKWERCGIFPPTLSTSELPMTFSSYNSVRRVLKATLLLAGLSLVLSPELLAEEAPEEESQSSEEPTADPADDVPNEPLPPSGNSGVDAELDAMIEASKTEAHIQQQARLGDVMELPDENVQKAESLTRSRYVTSALLGTVTGFGIGNRVNGTPARGRFYTGVDSLGLAGVIGGLGLIAGGDFTERESVQWTGFFLGVGGAYLMIGSRIVQVVDLWFEPLISGRVTSKTPYQSQPITFVPVFVPGRSALQLMGEF